MVSINQPGWFWSRHRQPGFCKQVVFLFLFFVLDFFIFFSACTCTVCVFLGFNRPAWLKPCARKEIILIWVSASATWILQTGRVLFFLHLRLFYFLFLVCTVHFASSWLSMVSIDLGSSLMQEEIILILVSASATWILQPRERYALVPLLIEFRISWYFIVHKIWVR